MTVEAAQAEAHDVFHELTIPSSKKARREKGGCSTAVAGLTEQQIFDNIRRTQVGLGFQTPLARESSGLAEAESSGSTQSFATGEIQRLEAEARQYAANAPRVNKPLEFMEAWCSAEEETGGASGSTDPPMQHFRVGASASSHTPASSSGLTASSFNCHRGRYTYSSSGRRWWNYEAQ